MAILKIILYLLLVVVLLLLVAIIRTLLIKQKVTTYEGSKDLKRINEYAKKLQKIIKVETVSVSDHPDPDKFRQLHKVIESLYPNVFKKCQKIDIDGNLLVKWKGKNPKLNPIILISHIDVVEAKGKWTYPPFSGKIVDGKIYGRGTSDIKSDVMAFYQAVEELIKEGYVPECDVYLGSSCTEEIGGDGAPKIVNWFKKRGITLFMLSDEGGCIIEEPITGIKGNYAAIGIFEKGYGDLKIIAKSNGGHSSTPPKNTPIARLAAFENEIEKHNPFKLEFSPVVENMFKGLAPYTQNFWFRLLMSNVWLFKPLLLKILPSISNEFAAMLKTTICFTTQKGSDGYNVIPQEAYVTANLRYIPHQANEECIEIIKNIASKYDLEVEVLTSSSPSKSLDMNGQAYKIACEAVNTAFPGVGFMPYILTGGTDARFFDDICESVIRMAPISLTKDQLSRMHGIDENLNIDTLPQAVDYYKAIIKLQETRK